MAANRQSTFTVEGTYPFPVDMLRYDACYPVSTEDAVQMGEAMILRRHTDPDRKRKVTLGTMLQNRPTVGRWNSFGWEVIS